MTETTASTAPGETPGEEADSESGNAPERLVPRRRDRGKEAAWIRTFLHRGAVGTLAVPVSGGAPHLNTNLFVYHEEGESIYLHTARTGALRDAVEGAMPVSFSLFEMGRLLPADEALEFSVEYRGVSVQGRCVVVEDVEEEEEALQRLLDKYAPHLRPGRDYRPITAGELRRTAVYRIDIEAWSGKEKRAEEDFPGAFRYPREGDGSPATVF